MDLTPPEPPQAVDGAADPTHEAGGAIADRPAGWRPLWTVLLGGLWLGSFVGSVLTRGIPFQREQVLAWVMAAMVVVAVCGPRHRVRQVLVDWLPFLAVLVVYDYSRGWADGAGFPVRYELPARLDRAMFGVLPSSWLQERLLNRNRASWWEAVTAVTYASHFVLPFAVAAGLWIRDRARWASFARRFVALSFLGVITFIVLPVAPPWLASRQGYIAEAVVRPLSRGWGVIGLDIAEQVLSKGQASVNLTAAVPSLHAGYSALVAVVLWPTANRIVRAVLVAYVLAMAFTLVFGGEHYVVDVLVGWAYVALVTFALGRTERWWSRRRERRAVDG